jgi:putative two-component system response regulator
MNNHTDAVHAGLLVQEELERRQNGTDRSVSSAKCRTCKSPTLLLAANVGTGPSLAKKLFGTASYRVLDAETSAAVFETLAAHSVDLVILPATGSTIRGLDCCRQIKAHPQTELVPVLIITSPGIESQLEALSAGADDFLTDPIHPDLARTRIRALLRHKAATDRLDQTETILFALAQAVEHRDATTGSHCDRLGVLSLALGIALGVSEDDLEALHRGGYLHDIGKVGIPDRVLFKPGPLDESEWEIMRTHTVRGEEICRPLRSFARVLPIIRNHHEKWNGTGYPDCLKGDQIPLLARILQFADIYDALTSARPYKEAFTPEKALTIMQQETKRGWRDPNLMQVFAALHLDTARTDTWREARTIHRSLRNLQNHLMQA